MQTQELRQVIPAAETNTGDQAFLKLKGITKRYGVDYMAVDDLDIDVPKGKLLGLLGPSGCGKTTTLRMIAGLLDITRSKITIDGDDISHKPPHKRDIGLVFQNYALFPHMTVAQNVAFGLEMRGVGRVEARDRVEEALEMVRLPGYGERKPKEMSGGQQQRVALARALVIRPRLLLLDEPLSNLDAKLRDDMRIEIREIQQRLQITTVFVTHDQVEALTMCDLVGVMHKGKLAQLGTPEDIYERPADLFVADFVGRTNILDGEIEALDRVRIGASVYPCNTRGLTSGKAKAAIRPHRISLTPSRDRSLVSMATNAAHGKVTRVTYIGDVVQYDIDIGGNTLTTEVHTASAGHSFQSGEKLLCEWKPQDMQVFAQGSGN
ncbi:putative spermidine/putrescine transport system ATP-binding protein [Neorhizobium huautlense]|uniref:Spermidine/putrescine transport system ATP-binding protein n=1 Tax=Neorhizobium huautlense TaxID=67774 RepID=A0ABT9PMR5_9HYPH|nr:ABC transporter ATP-binding protein [Neorhizobium huautlense]MDP9835732.1 putative spermidine/putrescine transport system ATP-binding protein [Neorhizobium huautlense]